MLVLWGVMTALSAMVDLDVEELYSCGCQRRSKL